MRKLVFILCLLPSYFAQADQSEKARCAIIVESAPRIYDKELLRTPGPIVGLDESIFYLVSADRTKVISLSRSEYDRRFKQNDYKDFNHGTLVAFQQAYEGGYDVSMTLIEADQSFRQMIYVESIGGLSQDHGLGLLVAQRRLYGLCSIRH